MKRIVLCLFLLAASLPAMAETQTPQKLAVEMAGQASFNALYEVLNYQAAKAARSGDRRENEIAIELADILAERATTTTEQTAAYNRKAIVLLNTGRQFREPQLLMDAIDLFKQAQSNIPLASRNCNSCFEVNIAVCETLLSEFTGKAELVNSAITRYETFLPQMRAEAGLSPIFIAEGHFSAGMAYLVRKSGEADAKKAVQSFQTAINLYPPDFGRVPTAKANLGRAYLMLAEHETETVALSKAEALAREMTKADVAIGQDEMAANYLLLAKALSLTFARTNAIQALLESETAYSRLIGFGQGSDPAVWSEAHEGRALSRMNLAKTKNKPELYKRAAEDFTIAANVMKQIGYPELASNLKKQAEAAAMLGKGE
jgi:hypothetical protein